MAMTLRTDEVLHGRPGRFGCGRGRIQAEDHPSSRVGPTVVFLDLSSSAPNVTKDAAFDLVIDVAKRVLDVEEIAARLCVTG